MDSLLETPQREFTVIPVAKHFFQNTTFRDIRISVPTTTYGDQVEMTFHIFAYDVLQGIFNYVIHFQTNTEQQQPLFTVKLLNIYPLGSHVVSQFARLFPDPDLYTPSPTPTNETRSAFRQVNLSSRGFLSAYTIGPRAKRAVWIERVRGNTTREVQVWSDVDQLKDGEVVDGPPGEIQRNAVLTITSPDLRGKYNIYPTLRPPNHAPLIHLFYVCRGYYTLRIERIDGTDCTWEPSGRIVLTRRRCLNKILYIRNR